jgi:hypothetical protein
VGNYNPHAPGILGNEWVPIKQANYVPDEVTERGYTFNIANAVTPVSGSYNIADAGGGSGVRHLLALYPAGLEDQTGPIKRVVIPISGAVITGSGSSVAGAATATLALTNPGSDAYVNFAPNPPPPIGVSFDMAPYAAQLNGKRILDVTVLYQVSSTPVNLAASTFKIRRAGGAGNSATFASGLDGSISLSRSPIGSASLGDINFFWDSTAMDPNFFESYPWRSNELSLFATTAGAFRLIGVFQFSAGVGIDTADGGIQGINLSYVALQVTYCEETRVRYGARFQSPVAGSHLVGMKDTSFAQPSLAAGDYTITAVRRGDPIFSSVDHAIRQLYELPSIVGIDVHESLTVGDTFTASRTDILPQLALHTASAVVTGSHVYGNQIAAPVYGSIVANQDVHEDDAAPAATYPHVRFYARRFGDTTVPLTLTAVDQGSVTVSITVADFDALPEIVDGWKEVTLRFASPPTFPTVSTNPNYRWSATGETAGNQWQILGADGPSPAAPQSYAAATYQAPNGATDQLQWMSPLISGAAADPLADATIILAVDPPTVTGFTLTPSTQPVTGIGLKCGTPPRCIPTGISYTQVTWSAVGLPVTGFGQYELERYDTIDGEWQTIMVASSPTVTGFNDYEARVGIASDYRIRACDVLDFCGAWTTGTATLPAPGTTGTGTGAGVLIFTSNANQAGAYNLAYCMQWEGTAREEFAFPEAGTVVFQDMYNKDFPTAFKQLERGGEQFSRTLLVQAAAISPERLADFRSLRDMAWADVPYIAVRDEIGDRWYATVMVPGGNVRRNRTLYFAQVDVVETTDTAYPVPLP